MKTIPVMLAALSALLLSCQPAKAGTTVNFGTISQISGPGGLDLAGEMTHAINFSANDPNRTVSGVTFVPDYTLPPGTTIGPNDVAPWQTKPEFGAGADDDELEEIYQDIRWANSAAGQTIEAHLPVTAGQTYKLQILFYGNHVADVRRWDIEVEGGIGVDEITSLGVDLPPWSPNAGCVYTHTILVADGTLDIRMGDFGGGFDGGDRNPIWQGLTVERVPPPTDSDGDGLPDAWEEQHFGVGNLSQTADGNPDADGLTNAQEFARGTVPTDPDTDDDLLTDGAEVNTHLTNPVQADTDGDGLNDGAEVNTHTTDPRDSDSDNDTLTDGAEINTHTTNPRNIDTDNDGFNDPTEVMNPPSDPVVGGSTPGPSHISRVLGADAGEGLDFTGSFTYAFNVGTPGAPFDPLSPTIGNATFTADTEPGITVTAQNEIPAWNNQINFGPSAGDATLAFIFQSIRWVEAGQLLVDLDNLVVGQRYKLQLMFGEECCLDRYYDIVIEGALVVDEFNTMLAQGGTPMRSAGSAFVYEFVAGDTQLNIILDGPGSTTGLHHNPILNGVTLEELTIPVDLAVSSVSRTATTLTINVRGTPGHTYSVDFSADLLTWAEAWDSLIPNANGDATWTDTDPLRVGAAVRRGFYKARDPVLDPTP